MKKQKIFVLLLLVFVFARIEVKAVDYTPYEGNGYAEYSDIYKEWLALDEEKRNSVPEPRKYGYSYTTNKRTIKNKLNVLKEYATLPSKFDLRDVDGVNYITPVKNQGTTDLCWAFASTSAFETNYFIRNSNKVIYNPLHISNVLEYNFTDIPNPYGYKEINTGGNFYNAVDYWTSGIGPVNNFNGDGVNRLNAKDTLDNNVSTKLDSYFELPSFDLNNNSVSDLPDFINIIKRSILENGEIFTTTAAPIIGSNYYNYSNYAAYTDNSSEYYNNPHAMTIIGWDDTFSKENFNVGTSSGSKPTIDGAWIVRNSWGEKLCYDLETSIASLKAFLEANYNRTFTREEVISNLINVQGYTVDEENQVACLENNDGFVYYSYQDYNINRSLEVVKDTSIIDYDYIYQYTPIGDSYLNSIAVGGLMVFDKSKDDELLTEISFDVEKTTSNVDAKIGYKIYVNASDGSTDSSNFVLVKEDNNAFNYSGYYTVSLDEPILLTGEQFAVKVVLTNGNIYAKRKANNYITKNSIVGLMPNQSYFVRSNNNLIDSYNSSSSLVIKAFTKKKISDSSVKVNSILKYNDSITMSINDSIDIKSITSNIDNGELLEYKIFNNENEDITDKFTLTDSVVISNYVASNLVLNENLGINTYIFKTYYDGQMVDEDYLYLKKEIFVNNLAITSSEAFNNYLYNGYGGNISFNITVTNLNLNNINIKVLDSNQSDKTNLFDIVKTTENDKINVIISVDSNIDVDNYKIVLSDTGNLANNEIPFEVLAFVELDNVMIQYNTKNVNELVLLKDDSIEINTILYPANASLKSVELSIENSGLASFSNNTITASSTGTTNIVIVGLNYTKKVPLVIIERPSIVYQDQTVNSNIQNTMIDQKYGGTFKQKVLINNYNETYMTFNTVNNNEKFTTSNSAISNNTLTVDVIYNEGLSSGVFSIESDLMISDTKESTIVNYFNVEIASYVPVSGISFTKNEYQLGKGTSVSVQSLGLSVSPNNATYAKVKCEIVSGDVIEINDCVINSLEVGDASIKVTSLDNDISSTISISVVNDYLTFDDSLLIVDNNIKKIEYDDSLIAYNDFTSKVRTNMAITILKSDKQTALATSENIATGMYLIVGDSEYNIVIQGDINGDGKVSILDLSQMRKHLAGIEGSLKEGAYMEACDINYDNRVSILDLSQLRKKLAGENQ